MVSLQESNSNEFDIDLFDSEEFSEIVMSKPNKKKFVQALNRVLPHLSAVNKFIKRKQADARCTVDGKPCIHWGKHKGTAYDELPVDYIMWLMSSSAPDGVKQSVWNRVGPDIQREVRNKREQQDDSNNC
jgi:hypothetical protein